ncbi:Golgi-associated RAB2 interactor protein 2-like [Heteronotia binoei]|uniref:Golgi-associated RAB2 interactor protein 2-like n=1 Tax=Heteronotia binoei TaxID=13085 RepID=UPI0029302B27|nr:Golgi-associated RAB2 interactor protein 2-like [Heteronotia binoei]XP_060119560.1 Golgi-associated RAB2 interactor protein 2-like [Heteronotia binoei]
MGDLQKILDRGEYLPLRSVPVFESNFIQVNRRGESIYLHNRPNYVTMGVCAASPNQSLPNVMLLAHTVPVSSQESISTSSSCTKTSYSEDELVLTRFLPLKYVKISIHSLKRNRIKLKLVSGRAYYLELSGPPQKQAFLFRQWVRLINLLKSKNSDASIVFKNFDMQEEQKATSNTPWKRNNQEQSVRDQEKRQEPEKAQILKQISSKRVTISEIVDPIEQVGKSRSQGAVSSYSFIRKSSMGSGKQNKQHQELRKNDTKKKSREREPFSYSEKRLQTSGILKNVSKPEVVYYK